MIQGTIPISVNGRVCLPGFRLKRLELLNWGTFCDEVHRIVPDGRWSLLVGDNGSGKSTTADALRTLLVPPGRLSYNDASTDQKLKHQGTGKDRTKVTYIRGAFRAKSQEDSAVPILQFHREERVPSIILAVFTNEVQQSDVTLAQLHWAHENRSDQIYLVARSDKTIKGDLSGVNPTSRDVKKELKRRGFEPDDSFPAYEERFRRLLGIPGKNALEVFNQVIGVKEVKDLCLFVRKHMLEASEARDFIDSHIRPNYLELNACWEAIKKAEAQLVLLNQVSEHFATLETATEAHTNLISLNEAVPHYFNQRRLELRQGYDRDLNERIAKLTIEKECAAAEQTRLQERKESLDLALSATEEGQRLKDIERDIGEFGAERDRRQKKLDKVREHFVTLGQTFGLQTKEQFDAMRRKLLIDKGPLEGNLDAHEGKKMEHYLGKASAEKTRDELAREAQTVRESGALIPRKFLEVRKQIGAQTGVSEKDLPFAGELMEVKSEYREWTGAIERLLRPLGTSMLVGERHYRIVADYINSTHLGIRLVFHQVPSVYHEARQDFLNDPNRVPARLSYLDRSPFIGWLQAEVTRQFSHPCCETVSELRQASFGITKEGLIKDGSRHVKDDGSKINDHTNYVLGWSTQTKLAALIEEFQAAERSVADHDRKFKAAIEQVKAISKKVSAIDVILQFETFDEIDVASKTAAIARLAAEKQQLEAADNKLGQLKKQQRDVEEALIPAQKAVSDLGEKIGAEKGRKQDNEAAINRLEIALKAALEDFEKFRDQIVRLQGTKTLTLDNVDSQAAVVEQQVGHRIRKKAQEKQDATEVLLPAMERFLNQYPQERATLKSGVEFGKDFVKLRNDIDGDELPKHRQRFFSLLNQKLILDMAALQTKLNNHETDIRQRIEAVNATLKQTRFSDDTYVHIRMTPANSDEIRKFKAELKACTSGGIQPNKDDLERIYTKIRELIGRFEQEPEWTARVIDARNWWDYGVQALYRADDKEAQYFAGSSGKSGGQKTILAFNILASAITAQYGLTGDDGEDINRFRLVVVDEAFSKTDPANSKRTMELFKALGLQLLVINPWDAKSRIVEDFVDTFHLAATDSETERSSLTRATRERYLEVQRAKDMERQAA